MVVESTPETEFMNEVAEYAALCPDRLWTKPGDTVATHGFAQDDPGRERRQGRLDGMAEVIFFGQGSSADIQNMVRQLVNVYRDVFAKQSHDAG